MIYFIFNLFETRNGIECKILSILTNKKFCCFSDTLGYFAKTLQSQNSQFKIKQLTFLKALHALKTRLKITQFEKVRFIKMMELKIDSS